MSSDDLDVVMKARVCSPAKNWGVAKAVEENADIIIYLFYLIPKGLGNWLWCAKTIRPKGRLLSTITIIQTGEQ